MKVTIISKEVNFAFLLIYFLNIYQFFKSENYTQLWISPMVYFILLIAINVLGYYHVKKRKNKNFGERSYTYSKNVNTTEGNFNFGMFIPEGPLKNAAGETVLADIKDEGVMNFLKSQPEFAHFGKHHFFFLYNNIPCEAIIYNRMTYYELHIRGKGSQDIGAGKGNDLVLNFMWFLKRNISIKQ